VIRIIDDNDPRPFPGAQAAGEEITAEVDEIRAAGDCRDQERGALGLADARLSASSKEFLTFIP